MLRLTTQLILHPLVIHLLYFPHDTDYRRQLPNGVAGGRSLRVPPGQLDGRGRPADPQDPTPR